MRNASVELKMAAAKEHSRHARYGQALALVLPLLQQDPDNLEALDLAAVCYVRIGDGQTAAKLLELIVEQRPDMPGAWAKLAGIRTTCGDKAGAAFAFERALEIRPDNLSTLSTYNILSPFHLDSDRAQRLRAVTAAARSSDAEKIQAHPPGRRVARAVL